MEREIEERLREFFKTTKKEVPPDFTEKVMGRIRSESKYRNKLRIMTFAYAASVFFIAVALLYFYFQARKPNTIVVTFKIEAPGAREVYLAGDFNNWQPDQIKLKKRNGEWYVELPLKPGRYQYNFVINGKEWVPDPNAELFVDNGFGQKNSVIDLTKI